MSLAPISVQGCFEHVVPPSFFSLKRVGTVSTKESHSTNDSSTASSVYYNFPSHNQNDMESGASTFSDDDDDSFTSRQSTLESTIDTDFESLVSKKPFDEETLPSLPSVVENSSCEDDSTEYEDEIIDTNIKNRTLSLAWERGDTVASSFRRGISKHCVVDDVCALPEGISKSDITVTIDMDDEARSSRVAELDEEDLDVEILHHTKHDSGDFSPRKQYHQTRRKFEENVCHGILDDLNSVYTAIPRTAKFVLCVMVSVLSDGTLNHTFWSGGRVGLTEIVLQWVLFDADDLQVYKRGRVVQKKDFGFGPLGLTEHEGQHYLATILAPRATNEIISKIGNGACKDLLSEF